MSSPLQNNITNLQSVLEAINELPQAGGEQVTPVISVNNSNGLITATAGTKTSTHQLAFQAAKTVTPSTLDQIAVSSGYYTGGNITVKGDSNLIASNIKSGVSIFGVSGTLEEGGGEADYSMEDGLIMRALDSYTNNRVSYIGLGAFYYNKTIKSVNFPNVTEIRHAHHSIKTYGAFENCTSLSYISAPNIVSIGNWAFYNCTSLKTIDFPACTNLAAMEIFAKCTRLSSVNLPNCTVIGAAINGASVFASCTKLTSINLPKCSFIGLSAFYSCTSLTTVNLPMCTTIYSYAFKRCYNLKSLYLTGSSICTLTTSEAFDSTPIGGYSTSAGTYGSIYVPASLLTSYQTATNWAYFSSRFVAYGSTMHSGGSSD